MKSVAILSSKGQVTIPADIREFFDLKKNDKLLFTPANNNLLLVKPLKKSFLEFGASIKPKQKPEDYAKIRKIVMKKMTI